MKKKLQNVCVVIFIAVVILFLSGSGINELVNTTKKKNIKMDYASSCIKVEHTVNALIPIGTEYYYFGYEEESNQLYIIRAGKKWLSENFNDEGEPNITGYTVKTYTKKLDYKVAKEVSDILLESIPDANVKVNVNEYQDVMYQSVAIKKLVGVFFLLISICCIMLSKNLGEYEDRKKKVYTYITVICLLIACILIIDALR